MIYNIKYTKTIFPGDMKDTCIIETTFDNSTTVYYADMVKDLSSKSMNSIRNIDATNEIILLVSTSKKYQFILAPSK